MESSWEFLIGNMSNNGNTIWGLPKPVIVYKGPEIIQINRNITFDTNLFGSSISILEQNKKSIVMSSFRTKDIKLLTTLRESEKLINGEARIARLKKGRCSTPLDAIALKYLFEDKDSIKIDWPNESRQYDDLYFFADGTIFITPKGDRYNFGVKLHRNQKPQYFFSPLLMKYSFNGFSVIFNKI